MPETPRLALYGFNESPRPAREALGEPMGTLYPLPYDRIGLDDFPTQLMRALEEAMGIHQRADEPFGVVVSLTPSEVPGGARVLDQKPHWCAIAVQLSPDEWKAATVAAKRTLLLRAAGSALRTVLKEAGIDRELLDRATRHVADAYDRCRSAAARLAAAEPVRIDGASYLELSRGLRSAQTVRRVEEAIARAGFDARFCVVPGGRMAPGMSPRAMRAAQPWFDAFFDGKVLEEGRLHVSDAPCDLRARGEVELAPFAIAESCLPGPPVEPPYDEWLYAWANFTFEEAVERCTKGRFSLPTSEQLEWVARSGGDRIFPWGDDCSPLIELVFGGEDEDDEDDDDDGWEQDAPPQRPSLDFMRGPNDFGVIGCLVQSTWCIPDFSNETTPLIVRGGALQSFPWQGGWESVALLTAAWAPWGIDRWNRAHLRPVIHLAPETS